MKVSIIVPVYNVENYIDKCLNSIVNQTYKNIEILVIIDGSTDRSESIVNEFASKDDRINIIKRENKGLLASRVEGIDKCKGDYIIFVDSDDWIEFDTVEILLNTAILENSDIVKCSYIRENIKENIRNNVEGPFKYKTSIENEDIKKILYPLLINTYYCNSCCFELIKKSKIKDLKINTNISMGEDLLLNIQIYKNVEKVTFIPNNLYHYRFNQNSISKNLDYKCIERRVFDVIYVYSQLEYFVDVQDNLYNQVYARVIIEASNQLSLLFLNKSNIRIQQSIIKNTMNSEQLDRVRRKVNILDLIKSKNNYSRNITIFMYKKWSFILFVYGNIIYTLIRLLRKNARLLITKIKNLL